MSKSSAEFAAFADARGPALARTASLLELDRARADDATVDALAWAVRHWRTIARDGNEEAEARHRLHRHVIDRWRRDAVLDVTPTTEDADAGARDTTPERRALATLTNRQRTLLVLTTYESLSASEAATLLRQVPENATDDVREAAAQLRRALGVADTAPLLPILDAASLRTATADLSERVLAASQSGGRRRVIVGSLGIAAITALVATAAIAMPGDDAATTDPVVAHISQWGIPDGLPTAKKLPSLAEQPIETASMAYVTDGVPIVVDAATGGARTVLSGRPQPAWYDGNVDGVVTGLLRRGPPWTQAVLSPDGQWLLLVQDAREAQGTDPLGDLYLARVGTGEVTPLPDADPMARSQGVASVADSVLAWAPGGGAFACVCANRMRVFDLDMATPMARTKWTTAARFTDVVWGREGLIGRRVSGSWVSQTRGGAPIGGLGSSDAVAASITTPAVYLSVGVTSIYAIGADTDPDGGRCVLWDADFTEPVEVQPLPDRDGPLCTPVALQPGRAAILLVLRESGVLDGAPLPLDVVSLESDGKSSTISSLPRGTSMASFASSLVG